MDIFETTRIKLDNQGLRIDRYDLNRPWGGFFVLDENQAQAFADIYFEGLDVAPLRIAGKLSPKILLVKPEARLSWQYHHRRAETWRIVDGPVGIVRSATDEEAELVRFEAGETIVLDLITRQMRTTLFVFRTTFLENNWEAAQSGLFYSLLSTFWRGRTPLRS